MKRIVFTLMILLLAISSYADYNVKDYGATGDGKSLDSPAVNAAIEDAVKNGGGKVVVPAGRYICGSIRMKSNIELCIEAGAVVIAAPASMKAYDRSEAFDFPEYQDGGHTYFHNSLIWADGEENVSITGRGMIDGEGLTTKDTETAGNVHGGSIGTGDKAIALKRCKNILIRDVTIYRGGHFAIIVTGCERGSIDNVTIDTNRDGIDIDCCKHISVANTKVNTPHDDAIVLKASYALKKAVACENILISNCTVTGFKCGTFLDCTCVPETVNWVCGRIKLGTESNGGYKDIAITNCTCIYSSGLAFEEVDQGMMENIVVSNIAMNHVHHYPIFITTGCRNRGPKDVAEPSRAQNIMISNVQALDCDSLCGIIITGMKDVPLKNISLSNIFVEYRGGGTKEQAEREFPELEQKYPEPAKFLGATPSYGLFARHIDGLTLRNIDFSLKKPDSRPAILLDDVKHEHLVDVNKGNY